MSWIKVVEESEATGALKDFYEKAKKRFGWVPNLYTAMSLNPNALMAYVTFAQASGFGSTRKRMQEELIATTVSSINKCHY